MFYSLISIKFIYLGVWCLHKYLSVSDILDAENPSCLQTTAALEVSQYWVHTEAQSPLWQISTRPAMFVTQPASLTSPSAHSVPRQDKEEIIMINDYRIFFKNQLKCQVLLMKFHSLFILPVCILHLTPASRRWLHHHVITGLDLQSVNFASFPTQLIPLSKIGPTPWPNLELLRATAPRECIWMQQHQIKVS